MFAKILDAQYRRPTGLLGRMIGRRMARDHRPENLWSIALLQAVPEDAVLELGFGPGFAIQALTKVVTRGRIAGIDFSREMVVAARGRNAAAVRCGLVDLHYGDAADMPFQDGEFDLAYSIHSIYFWPQPLAVLQAVYRELKPAGKFVLTVLPKERWNENNPSKPVGTPECIPYSGEELISLLVAAGFNGRRIETDPNPKFRSNYSMIGSK